MKLECTIGGMRLPIALLFCAALAWAQPKTEAGEINGAQFRIDTPEKWNGVLVLYCHPYSPVPAVFDDKPYPLLSLFLSLGYAVAQSGYSAGGWAVQEAVLDVEDPGAVAYLQRYYTPTGRLSRPLLAIHTTYDPSVPPWITNMYSKTVEGAGSDKFFVQQYVRHDGHCAIQPAEIARGFMQLRQWAAAGARPAPGLPH